MKTGHSGLAVWQTGGSSFSIELLYPFFWSKLTTISLLSCFLYLLSLISILLLARATCQTMKREGSRQGTKWLNTIKGDHSREPWLNKICLEETWRSAVLLTRMQTTAQMMTLRMRHMFHLLGLILMGKGKGWQVLVAAGQWGLRRLRRTMTVMMGLMVRRRKKILMYRRSTFPPTFTWELQFFGYLWIRIGGRKSATGAKQTWWEKREKKTQGLLRRNLALTIDFTWHFSRTSESVIIPKNKPVPISQWIYWNYMEGKSVRIFDEVVTACRAKHLRDVMAFRKNWNNEIIA
jgi:hypothetical protein